MFQGTRHAPVATPNSKEAQSAAGWMIETQANRPQQPGHSARGPHMLSPCSPLPVSASAKILIAPNEDSPTPDKG
jgi:hypothetical protein